MKADKSGTPTEQVRYRAGWASAGKKARNESCRDCWHCRYDGKNHWRCDKYEFATAQRAVCDDFGTDTPGG